MVYTSKSLYQPSNKPKYNVDRDHYRQVYGDTLSSINSRSSFWNRERRGSPWPWYEQAKLQHKDDKLLHTEQKREHKDYQAEYKKQFEENMRIYQETQRINLETEREGKILKQQNPQQPDDSVTQSKQSYKDNAILYYNNSLFIKSSNFKLYSLTTLNLINYPNSFLISKMLFFRTCSFYPLLIDKFYSISDGPTNRVIVLTRLFTILYISFCNRETTQRCCPVGEKIEAIPQSGRHMIL